MDLRFCPRCRAEVEDAGGYCLLGHTFPPAPEEDPIADLRAEVDEALSKVRIDLHAVAASAASTAPALPARSLGYEALAPRDEDVAEEIVEGRRDLWNELSTDTKIEGNDPILFFSPSPRMEWGPERRRRRRPRA